MPGKVKDMRDAFLYRLPLECLADGHGLGESRTAAVHVLYGVAGNYILD